MTSSITSTSADKAQEKGRCRERMKASLAGLSEVDAALFRACAESRIDDVVTAIAMGANPDSRNALGENALFFVSNAEIAKKLIALGVPLVVNVMGQSVIQKSNDKDTYGVFLEKAKESGMLDDGDEPALHLAAEQGDCSMAEALCDAGAEIDKVSSKGMSPLLVAAKAGKMDVVKLLVEKGADVGSCDAKGRTCLHLAVIARARYLVEFLVTLDAELVSAVDGDGHVPSYYADRELSSVFAQAKAAEEPTIDAGEMKVPERPASSDKKRVVPQAGSQRIIVFEDDAIDIQGADVVGAPSELQRSANEFLARAGNAIRVVSSSLACVAMPSNNANAPGRIRRTLVLVYELL